MDGVSTELILSSTITSFEKIAEFLTTEKTQQAEWKREQAAAKTESCMAKADEAFSSAKKNTNLMSATLLEMQKRKTKVFEQIRELLKSQ